MKTKPLSIIKRLFFVPTCASCKIRLSPIPDITLPTYGKVCFCANCAEMWHRSKAKMCPVCSQSAEKCLCTPNFFKKYQKYIPSVCFYSPEAPDVPSKAILTAKKKNNSELFEFFAISLAANLNALLKEMNIDPKECTVTWMPRQRSSVNKHGFDQGKRLAHCVAKIMGADISEFFARRGGKEQKKLDRSERKLNADRSIILNKKLSRGKKEIKDLVSGKNIIILDDVITSGATLKRGFLLLLPLKPKNIIAATVAKTAIKATKTK